MSLRVGCVTTWSWGSHHLVSELGTINQVISFWNFHFLLFPQKNPMSNFFFSLNLQHIKKFVILFCYCLKYINSIKKQKKKRKEFWKKKNKSFKKTFIGFYKSKKMMWISNWKTYFTLYITSKTRYVAIDGGSCANIASDTLVKKSNLSYIKHPRPYWLQWLNECGEVKVTKQVINT